MRLAEATAGGHDPSSCTIASVQKTVSEQSAYWASQSTTYRSKIVRIASAQQGPLKMCKTAGKDNVPGLD
jgi:hypothetical protein